MALFELAAVAPLLISRIDRKVALWIKWPIHLVGLLRLSQFVSSGGKNPARSDPLVLKAYTVAYSSKSLGGSPFSTITV